MKTRRVHSDRIQSSVCLFRRAAALGVCFTLAASLTARAGDILRGGGVTANPRGGAAAGANPVDTTQARVNAQDALARTSQAVQAVRAMQNAARNLSRGGPNNLGLDPNHPGQPLPNIPNGYLEEAASRRMHLLLG